MPFQPPQKVMRVVMIDDDEDDYLLIQSLLSCGAYYSYKTDWAKSYEEGLAAIRAEVADVFLLDYRLGEKNGLDLLDEVGTSGLKKPIIFLTGEKAADIDLAAMEKGAAYFVQKSQINNDHLLERTIRYVTRASAIQEKVRVTERLKVEKLAAETSNQAKSLFLANISHEIRTPLAAIIGFTDLIIDDALARPEKKKFLQIIKKNAHHLMVLVNDLLDLSKIEANKLGVVTEQTDWRSIIEDGVDLLRLSAEAKGNSVSIEIEGHVPEVLITDPQCFRQIFLNILANAIKFTNAGHVAIRVKSDQEFSVSVKDDGVGMTPEDQERLFQPFVQGRAGTYRKFGGTGLGLCLSKKLARLVGGDLVLSSSAEGIGSTFILKLPALMQRRQKVEKRIGPSQPLRVQLSGLKILLAEDSEDSQILIRHILRDSGGVVEVAKNGREAVTMAKDGNFDVILMDVQMPEMDGVEATQALRASGFLKPIFALSAHAMKDEASRVLAMGFDQYLTKPLDKVLLFSKLAGVAHSAR